MPNFLFRGMIRVEKIRRFQMMKRKPSDLPKMSKPKSVKKTIVINCFTGEEREVDRRKIKIVDGMEVGNTRVELDNGVKLAVAGEGKYHTLGNPK